MTRVKPLFLLATLIDGGQVVAEFSKLEGSGEGYVSNVFAGRKTFNAWKVVGDTHPHSGEKVLLRQRVMLNGRVIERVIPVQPKAGFEERHEYEPGNFEPVIEVQNGAGGKYVAPLTGTPEGAVAGATYPVHREEGSLEKYVILKVASPTETNPLEGEVRFWVDRNRVTTNGALLPEDVPLVEAGPGDGDDDGWDSTDDRDDDEGEGR
jgi:hypothetical protein